MLIEHAGDIEEDIELLKKLSVDFFPKNVKNREKTVVVRFWHDVSYAVEVFFTDIDNKCRYSVEKIGNVVTYVKNLSEKRTVRLD